MYKVIINKTNIKEFKNIDKAVAYYGENFKTAETIILKDENKIICKKLN